MSDTYKCKAGLLTGTSAKEIEKKARRLFHDVENKTRRKAYIRSKSFDGEKIFVATFWDHFSKKNYRDRERRLRYYQCALELLARSTVKPEVIFENKSEKIYRLSGVTDNGAKFMVRVRFETKTKAHYFTSVFPYD